MEKRLRPARAVAPGRILSREIEARGWTQKDLARIMGRPPQAINQIINGTKQITPETALELSEAIGTSPEFWSNLETNYRLHLARGEGKSDDIARRSRIYSLGPIQELINRSWITDTGSLDDLEREVCRFLWIATPDAPTELVASFRRSKYREPGTKALFAWVRRVEHLARSQRVREFDPATLERSIPDILSHSLRAEDVSRVPTTLMGLGIHLVIVPHLNQTYLDGAALYIDKRPIVALTLRHNRIDAFWFTLMHELAHIIMHHGDAYLDDIEDPPDNEKEEVANNLARDWLLDSKAVDAFMDQTRPYFSRSKILRFAEEQKRHPGIVLGRLQYEREVGYSHLRSLLDKIKQYLKEWIDVPHPN